MKKAIFSSILLYAAAAGGQSIPASIASGNHLNATFDDVHHAFTRIVLNESGWYSRPDANGIMETILTNTGGRKNASRVLMDSTTIKS